MQCGLDVLSSYLQLNGDLQQLDTSCAQNVEPVQFSSIVIPALAEPYFGNATDLYGEESV